MTRETLLTLVAAFSIGFYAYLSHVDPVGGITTTVQIAEGY